MIIIERIETYIIYYHNINQQGNSLYIRWTCLSIGMLPITRVHYKFTIKSL